MPDVEHGGASPQSGPTPSPSPSSFQLRHYTAKSLPLPLLQWCFDLVKSTLHDLYLPVWGWSDTDKRKQLEAVSGIGLSSSSQPGV